MDKINLLLRMYYNLKQNISNDLAFETNLNRFYKYSYYLVLNLKKKEILEFLYGKPDDFILLFFYLSTFDTDTLIYHKKVVTKIVTKNNGGILLRIAFKEFLKFTGFRIESSNNRINSISSDILLDKKSLLTMKDIYRHVFKKRLHLLRAWKVLDPLITKLIPIINLKSQVECCLVLSLIRSRGLFADEVFKKFISSLITNPHNSAQIKIIIISFLPDLISSINKNQEIIRITLSSILILFDLIKNPDNISFLETIFDTIHILLDKNQLYKYHLIELKDYFEKSQLEEIINQLLKNENKDITIRSKCYKLIRRINTF